MLAQIMNSKTIDDVSHGHRDEGNDITYSKDSIDREIEKNSPLEMIGSGGVGAGFNSNFNL